MLTSQPRSAPVYRPRKPHLTPFYQCVQDHWEVLEGVWEERFRKRFGFLRKHLKQVMVHFLECGDLHAGFARVRCGEKIEAKGVFAYHVNEAGKVVHLRAYWDYDTTVKGVGA